MDRMHLEGYKLARMKLHFKSMVCLLVLGVGFAGLAQAEPVSTGNGSPVTTGQSTGTKHHKKTKKHRKHRKHHKKTTKTSTALQPPATH